MTHNGTRIVNAQQIEYWNGEAGEQWSERNDEMDTMLQPLGAEAMDRARPQMGEHVLDIGCGCGGTSFDLVATVGETGRVLGVDISWPMLALANRKIAALSPELQNSIDFEVADASVFDFPAQAFDLLFSRFGVMFFEDPTAAFSNMRRALKRGGRLCFLCWGPVDQNAWITVPMKAAMAFLKPPAPMDPTEPGPFAFADPAYLRSVLEAAGYEQLKFEVTTPTMNIGRGRTLLEAAEFFMDMGPVSRALDGETDDVRHKVREAIAAAITEWVDGDAVALQGRCWVVSALNP